ncbi:DUF5691 domain-containing protein [Halostreptopolyspora alba]|uniref:Uncharacterized protein n=1 Tax=Halostreptopolyspora alba TaxID=2487137 RepID=A0A3N0E7Y4_9ACTN|nr:hypothetical protein EFW17_13705 [Nocardiopsaceae bacterium YIM 96095]
MTEGDSRGADTWPSLVSTALMGVNRREVPRAADLPATPAEEPAAALLDRAAAAVVRRRAGQVPGTAEPVPPAPAETRPVVPDAAARRLEVVLAGEHTRFGLQDVSGTRVWLLGEWLELATERGMRVPPKALARVLDRGRSDRDLRPRIAAAVGERGHWLAGHNPKWSYLAEHGLPDERFDPEVWEHGSPAERHRTLVTLRARAPARARELLEGVWAGERAGPRRELLLTLDTNLSVDDEPFLERALDDRGAAVRGAALALLARLPDSAHADRLCAYAREHVWLGAPNRGGDRPLRVVAPEPTDSDLARDLALVTKTNGKGSGDARGEWLWALVTHTPLRFWPGHLDASPAEVGALVAGAGEWDLLAALGNAAVVQRDPEWARALLPAIERFHGEPRSRRGQVPEPGALLAVLPVAERCAWVSRLLAEDHERVLRMPWGISGLVGSRWTEELGGRVAEVIDQLSTSGRRTNHLPGVCFDASFGMPPTMYERFTPTTSNPPSNVVQLGATLRFRHEMRAEFG